MQILTLLFSWVAFVETFLVYTQPTIAELNGNALKTPQKDRVFFASLEAIESYLLIYLVGVRVCYAFRASMAAPTAFPTFPYSGKETVVPSCSATPGSR